MFHIVLGTLCLSTFSYSQFCCFEISNLLSICEILDEILRLTYICYSQKIFLNSFVFICGGILAKDMSHYFMK